MNTIRQTWQIWLAWLLVVAPGPSAAARQTDNPEAISYSAFKPIAERNIFNQSRSIRAPRSVASKSLQVETFGLTGTLSSEKGTFAFFDGTSPAYRKVLQPEGTIAGYKVTAIKPEAVTLEGGDKKLELRVGTQLTREDEGEWKVAATSVAASSAGRKGNSSSSSIHNSKSDSRKISPSKHKHSDTPDSSQYSKKEISAILKEEKRALAEELKDYPQEELQGMKYVIDKPMKKGRRKKSR